MSPEERGHAALTWDRDAPEMRIDADPGRGPETCVLHLYKDGLGSKPFATSRRQADGTWEPWQVTDPAPEEGVLDAILTKWCRAGAK